LRPLARKKRFVPRAQPRQSCWRYVIRLIDHALL
jgi:hypothetical protein